MSGLIAHENGTLFLSLGILLLSARVLGELMQRFGQPSVLGEMLAGIILGPTLLGWLFPEWHQFLFPALGPRAVVLEGLATIGIALFLLVVGMELDLSAVWRQGRAVFYVAAGGQILPFALSFGLAWFLPGLFESGGQVAPLTLALFIGTAMSITAVPVISKILMDLGLYRTDFGMVIVASAMVNDITGWILFAMVLSTMGVRSGFGLAMSHATVLVLAFVAGMLTIGRALIHRALPWVQAHMTWPGGVLGSAIALAFFAAAFTEAGGVHAVLGAFLVGVAIGDSSHLREQTRRNISHFISFIFAPLFFATIGLRMDFFANFDLRLVAVVLAVACTGKLIGCAAGARLAGMSRRESWATGIGMNARGTMEIVLGTLALESGLISGPLFEALVVMALVTAVLPGPVLQFLLKRRRRLAIADLLSARTFHATLAAADRWDAIRQLALATAETLGLDQLDVCETVLKRERAMATGIGHGVAVPHGRLDRLDRPVVAVGVSQAGLDFDAPDGQPVRLVFLVLTPVHDNGAQLEILADISQHCLKPALMERATRAANYTEFLATLKTAEA
ncbi:MAG TPA: cation:proton antiporter [Candidatus Bathyarchaeia archaeon]|nr:cation:proton antiporter [Candidatus Bathyarchaeia archaeon]